MASLALKFHLLKPSQILPKTTIFSNLTFSHLFSSSYDNDNDYKAKQLAEQLASFPKNSSSSSSNNFDRLSIDAIKQSLRNTNAKVGEVGRSKKKKKINAAIIEGFKRWRSFFQGHKDIVTLKSHKPAFMPANNSFQLLTPLSHQCSSPDSPPLSSSPIAVAVEVENPKVAAANDRKEKRFMWRNDEMIVFCKILIKCFENCGREQGINWQLVRTELEPKIKRKCPLQKLRNKYAAMRSDWKLWKFLKMDETNPATASRRWWERKVKENPDVKKFRRKCLHPTVEDLWGQLFEDGYVPRVGVTSTNVSVEDGTGNLSFEALKEGQLKKGNDEEDGGDSEDIVSKINEIEERLSNDFEDLRRIRQPFLDEKSYKMQVQEQQSSADYSNNQPRNVYLLSSLERFQSILETHARPNQPVPLKKSKLEVPADVERLYAINKMLRDAKNTLEIDAFTVYSLLCIALALPHDGKIIVIGRHKEANKFGLPTFIKKVGNEQKIEFVDRNASEILNDLLNKGKEGTFDFAFVDADQKNYKHYHEALMKLIKVDGAIFYDNTLQIGSVVVQDDVKNFESGFGIPENKSIQSVHEDIRDVNRFLVSDPRVGIIHVSVEDGITVCRRMY